LIPPPGAPMEGVPEVSIVLATLNERNNVGELFARIRALPLTSFEAIVVDDGSTDGTREFVADLARSDSRIRLLTHDGKQTTLRAQCQGIDASRSPYLVVMDADLQHPPEILTSILGGLRAGAAVVIASRYVPGGTAGPRTIARRVLSRGAEWLAKGFVPAARRVTDPVSGYFGFRRSIWIPLNSQYRGYKLLLFVLAMVGTLKVAEVPFRFTPRVEGASKVTEGPAFLRHFLIEVLLARKLSSSTRLRERQLHMHSEPTR
jgi:dolichol-phosphate mannosyltransferase